MPSSNAADPLVLPTQFPRTIGPNCLKYLTEVIESGLSTDMVTRFETAFAHELGVKHCIATPGCTPALAALAAALPFEPGDEIVVSPITDYGTLQGVVREGYIPVFPDSAPGTVNMSAETIAPVLSDRTRGILCVHLTGLFCDMDPINELAKKHDLMVFEDACQAVFGVYKGRLAGTLGHAGAFSFDAEKTMGSDMGGCIVTDYDDLAERIRFVGQNRAGVQKEHYGRLHTEAGYASRMPYCTAAVTLAQLEIARDQVLHRDKMARLLTRKLAEIPGITPLPIPDYVDIYSCWMVGISIDPDAFSCTAEEFAAQMTEAGIPGAGQGKYYLMPEALTFLEEGASKKTFPYSKPPASKNYSYSSEQYPTAKAFLETFIRWATFCEKYRPEHCDLAAQIVAEVAEKNRA